MSIATELENYRTGLTAAYAAAEAKGATIPEQKNLNNLSGTIESVPAGSGPIEYVVNENGKISKATVDFKLPSDVKDLGAYVFNYAFAYSEAIKTADLSSLTAISGSYGAAYMFNGCGLTSVDLSSLTTISGSYGATFMLAECSLTSVEFSSLTTISGSSGAAYMFNNCSKLTSVDLSSLTTISSGYGVNSMFANCTKLTSVNLSSLTAIRGNYAFQNAFRTCTNLKELRFPALTADSFGNYTNQFNNMLSSVTGCTLHFPAVAQAKIETMQGYPNFGGTNTVVLFDL